MRRCLSLFLFALTCLTVVPSAFAAHVQSCVGSVSGSGGVLSQSCGVTNAIGANDAAVGLVFYNNSTSNSLTTIVDDQGNPYTILDTNGPHFTGGWYAASFVGYNLMNGPKTITANFSGVGNTISVQIVWDEKSGVSGTDGHTAAYNAAVTMQPSGLSSGTVTMTVPGDTIWGAAGAATGVVEDTPTGSGVVTRINDTAHNGTGNGAVTDDVVKSAAGPVAATFTSSVSGHSQMAFVVAMKPVTGPAVPTDISCAPVALLDNAHANDPVCPFTVTMSNGSTYSGNNTVSPSTFFKSSAPTGNATLQLFRDLMPSDDGIQVATVQASQNGTTISRTFNVQVSPVSGLPGIPFTIGWKNIDPGASSNDGMGIVTMPHPGTLTGISVRVLTPASPTPALFDLFHAAPGQPCKNGSKIHVGDLDAAHAVDSVQIVSGSNLQNTSLAVNDTICVVTQQPFPTNGTLLVTVTVN
jgi:hypothetical protein